MLSIVKGGYKNSLTKKTAIISIIVSVITVGIACNFTYRSVRKSAVKSAAKQVGETINQLSDKINDNIFFIYDLYSNIEIDREFVNIASKQDGKFNLNDFSVLSEMFNDAHVFNSKIIDSIIFIRNDGQIFYEYQKSVDGSIDYQQLDWYKKTDKNDGFAIWYPPYNNELFVHLGKETIGLMKTITNSVYSKMGILIMNINVSYFGNELDKLQMGERTELFIVDNENNIIAAANGNVAKCENIINELLENKEVLSQTYYYDNRKVRIIDSRIGNTQWKIIGVIPEDELAGEANILILWIITAIFTGVVITLALMLFVLNNITIPLNKLTKVMQQTDGKSGRRIRYTAKEKERSDEIGYLAQSYNKMIDNIEELIEQIKEKSEEESKMQLRALQQQINSHFLYNTLDTIYWKVVSGDKIESADMVKRLSTFFRLALNRGDDITTVEKEIQHIENYVAIEKYRYKNKIECIIDVDKQIYDFYIPKLLIQPLIENAIVHGVFTLKENAFVVVKGILDGKNVVFTVEDNGIGMDVEAVEKYVKSNEKEEDLKNSFALRNIYKRIKLYYKEKGDMQFYINEYGGAGNKIILPVTDRDALDIET